MLFEALQSTALTVYRNLQNLLQSSLLEIPYDKPSSQVNNGHRRISESNCTIKQTLGRIFLESIP